MLRRSTCGNICCILCTATSLDLINCSAVLTGGRSGRGPEKKRYRTISPETSRTMAKNGSEICSSDMVSDLEPAAAVSLSWGKLFAISAQEVTSVEVVFL